MAIYLNERTLDSELLDTTNVAVIAENFTYLIKNLMDFVDPNISYSTVNKPMLKGGKRRAVRGERSEGLGYQYKTAASKSSVTSRGTKTIKAFGTDILVEEWTVSHGDVTDPDLGETYPAADGQGPRGPYTCLMTARISLSRKTPTRCYVQCNCQDFKATFYEKLNNQEYTNPQSLPASTGKRALAPAICKHLYAIYAKYYRDLVNKTEGFAVDQSAELFGGGSVAGGPSSGPIAPVTPVAPVVAKTRDEAIKLVKARLTQEYNRLKNNEFAYLDSRSKASGGGRHHLYMFSVALLNGNLRAITYRNKNVADPKYKNNSQIQLLIIPDNPKIWTLLNKKSDHKLLWDMIRSFPEMPDSMNKAIEKRLGVGVYMETAEIEITDVSYLIEAGSSSILSSISELS
jgi:hypothetical protein